MPMTDTTEITALQALTKWIDAHPVSGSPRDMRRAFATLAGLQPRLGRSQIAGIDCPAVAKGPPDVLWLHGGGYVFGGVESHANCALALATALGGRVTLPLYPLAPEDPWPAQLTAMQRVLAALPQKVHLVGDSAGGHLALCLAISRPDAVSSLALISPNTDRSGQSTTRAANSESDPMNDDAQDNALAEIAGVTPDALLASPHLEALDDLPPTFLTYSDTEVLADDARLLVGSLERAGVPVTCQIAQGLPHMWTLWPDRLPQAARTLADIARFITAHEAHP